MGGPSSMSWLMRLARSYSKTYNTITQISPEKSMPQTLNKPHTLQLWDMLYKHALGQGLDKVKYQELCRVLIAGGISLDEIRSLVAEAATLNASFQKTKTNKKQESPRPDIAKNRQIAPEVHRAIQVFRNDVSRSTVEHLLDIGISAEDIIARFEVL